jgi:hypothetical protein
MIVSRRVSLVLAALACTALGGALAASAGAATLKLRCAGKGARNRDSAGTVLCAGSPAKGRRVAGVVRNDAGDPVAAKITVTFSSWTPVRGGSGYNVRPRATREITAKADGTFSVKSNPRTRESLRFDVVADAALGVSAGAFGQAEVLRKLKVTIGKPGGGVVKVTVKGTRVRPIKVWILDANGYQLPGVRPRNVNARGQATFDLGSRRGRFATFVDSGVYTDLFWYLGRPTFRL